MDQSITQQRNLVLKNIIVYWWCICYYGISIGTKKVKAVNKIVGAGSKWVALAKKIVFLEGLCGVESANYGKRDFCYKILKSRIASSMIAQSRTQILR